MCKYPLLDLQSFVDGIVTIAAIPVHLYVVITSNYFIFMSVS